MHMKHLPAFISLITFLNISAQVKIGFLNINDAIEKNAEVKAAYNFLKNQKDFSIEQINYDDVINSRPRLPAGRFSIQQFSILWYHRPDSTNLLKQELNPEFIATLKNFISKGGKLFLTLDAVKLINELGLETQPIQISHAQAVDDGYGRKLGIHAFRSHPIFNGLHGGAYIFSPYQDQTVRQLGYFDQTIPNGKVIAIDWSYITFKENSKIVLEYNLGKGKVLAVGAYTNYSMKNWNRVHLELFTKNCLDYLAEKFDKEKKYYWNYKPNQVLHFDTSIENSQPLIFTQSKKWNINPAEVKITREKGTNNFWNVAGQRMLVMGKENGGVDEIWAHPFMALRDYEVGIEEKDSVRWLKNLSPQIEVRPESFVRVYNIDSKKLKEIVTASISKPIAVLHYEYDGADPIKLVIKFKSNLRYMWPYSEKVLGSINYNWNEKLNAFIVKDESGDFVTLIGANKKPYEKIIGKYESFHKTNNTFYGDRTEKFQVGGLASFKIGALENLDIIIAASNEGLTQTAKEYSNVILTPEKVFAEASNYANEFFKNSLMITSPDKNFNEGYRWALIGADRFFVNTPGVGKSLVAGYSTTASGWDGGHKVNGRPGYGWYFGRDGCWSGFALLDYGDYDKVKSILEFFNKYQDLSGKIFHELTTSGAVHYDASDSTPLYIILAGKYLHHTGDVKFIKQNWLHIKKAIDYCYSTDTDGDHLIENTNVGHGWVEGGGLYTAHTEVYLAACWSAALREASYMAEQIGLSAERRTYSDEFERVKKITNTDFWNEQENFLSFSKLKDGKFNSEKTVLAAVPVYFNMLDSIKAKKIVDAYAENYFSSDWGVRILREDSPIFNPRGYHTGSVWPLFTGWAALAEYQNGNYFQGYSHIMNNLMVYKNWQLGFVEEVLNGAEYKPGGVCPHQAWSETMVLQPAIEGMLGLEVDAANNKIKFSPRLPADWSSIKVERIKIGRHFINFSMNRSSGKTFYDFSSSSSKQLMIDFNPTLPLGIKIVKAMINSKPITIEQSNNGIIHLSFKLGKTAKVVIEFTGGISVLPVVSHPMPNDKSEGFRILSDKLEGDAYLVEVQGISGTTQTLEVYRNGKIEKVEVKFEKSDKKYINKTVKVKIER